MILVHVQHYLSTEGRNQFDDWLQEVARALQHFDGFISITRMEPIEAVDECHLLLKFESLNLLRQWSNSSEHDQMISRLAPYRQKPQRSRIFRLGDSI